MKISKLILAGGICLSTIATVFASNVELGPRPNYLINQMADSALKQKLLSCASMPFAKTNFSIAHRGAAMQFPEHTKESYIAAAGMGAGIIECDVTFTKDQELVCRHGQNDLHTTTNILSSDLADTCKTPFSPAAGDRKAAAECRTSDITLAEFKSLSGKMDAANKSGKTVVEYMNGTAGWRTDLYAASGGELMSHVEYIQLVKSLGAKFTPELKSTVVEMPFNGFTQADYAQKMISEYKAANILPKDVYVQSFNLNDILYWIENEPEFGKQAVYLDDSYNRQDFDHNKPETFKPSMQDLADKGVNYIAPPLFFLVTLENGRIVPSAYAKSAKAAGLKLITWTLERSGPLKTGGGWYYQSVAEAIKGDGQMYELLDVLAKNVGVEGVFSDWPATVSYYANCMGLK